MSEDAYRAAETVLRCDESPTHLRVKAGLIILEAYRAERALRIGFETEAVHTSNKAMDLQLALNAERDKMKELEAGGSWHDRADQWSAEIEKVRESIGPHYDTARDMVSARYSKGSLIALTNWLLTRASNAETTTNRLREAINDALHCTPHVRDGKIIYDCGDPWEILIATLAENAAPRDKEMHHATN